MTGSTRVARRPGTDAAIAATSASSSRDGDERQRIGRA